MKRIFILGVLAALVFATIGATVYGSNTPTTTKPISLTVVVSTTGPLDDCFAVPCPANTIVSIYLFVFNHNAPGFAGCCSNLTARNQLPNAYVASSVDLGVAVNGSGGAPFPAFGPPPDGLRSNKSQWSSTVTCTVPGSCTISKPAVIPGEYAVICYFGWVHGFNEPDGTYVFTVVVHGTVNGVAMDLSGSTNGIVMT